MNSDRQPNVESRIYRAYGLEISQLLPSERGYRNRSFPAKLADGRNANLIIYKADADILSRIKNANYVGNYLALRGMPARHTLDPRIIALRSPARTKYGAVYNYLPGRTIPWEAYTMKHLKLLGRALGSLHVNLTALERPQSLPSATAEYLAITGRMQTYFATPAVQQALADKLRLQLNPMHLPKSARLLEYCETLPHQQILHLDFVRSNILFTSQPTTSETLQIGDVAITGILDFEKTAFGHPAFDLARTLAFLLVDCKYKPEVKIRRYFLDSGYAKRGRGQLPPAALLVPLVTFFLTYDFYKFLRHNPYESLPQNQHFVRTRAFLLRRGVITPAPAARFATNLAKPLL